MHCAVDPVKKLHYQMLEFSAVLMHFYNKRSYQHTSCMNFNLGAFRLRLLCYSCIIVSSEVHCQNVKINPSKEEKEQQFQCDALKVLTLELCSVNDESKELRGVSRPLQIQQFSPCYSPQNITNSLLKVYLYSGSFWLCRLSGSSSVPYYV